MLNVSTQPCSLSALLPLSLARKVLWDGAESLPFLFMDSFWLGLESRGGWGKIRALFVGRELIFVVFFKVLNIFLYIQRTVMHVQMQLAKLYVPKLKSQ